MTAEFVEATKRRPFSNGSEGAAWMHVWCNYCVHDHGMHDDGMMASSPPSSVPPRGMAGSPGEPMCAIIGGAMMTPRDEWRWPEAWTPEPPGSFSIPSRLICGAFKACTEGACTGDPAPDARAERAALVHLEWESHR